MSKVIPATFCFQILCEINIGTFLCCFVSLVEYVNSFNFKRFCQNFLSFRAGKQNRRRYCVNLFHSFGSRIVFFFSDQVLASTFYFLPKPSFIFEKKFPWQESLIKKWIFLSNISSVNMNKSAVFSYFFKFALEILNRNLCFFVHRLILPRTKVKI